MTPFLLAARLYGIIDMSYVAESDIGSTTEALLNGGADIIQFRAKGYSEAEVLKLLKEKAPGLVALCCRYGVPLIINDFPRVAAEIKADGVHLGQEDGSLAEARAVVGPHMIVGRSTHSPEQAEAALDEGFDYIGFGPLFPTPTKKGRPGIGMKHVADVQSVVGSQIPMFCIGGIKPDNLREVIAAGARRVVIVSSLLQAPDIKKATEECAGML